MLPAAAIAEFDAAGRPTRIPGDPPRGLSAHTLQGCRPGRRSRLPDDAEPNPLSSSAEVESGLQPVVACEIGRASTCLDDRMAGFGGEPLTEEYGQENRQ